MRFAAQPVNVEGNGGPALRVSVPLADCPPEGATFALWAARLPDALSVPDITALASGSYDLAAFGAVTQAGPKHGLRQAAADSLVVNYDTSGTAATLEASLFNPFTDQPPRCANAPSWDVIASPYLERSDGPWLLAVTALPLDGSGPVIALGGLGQQAGQEHLAGVVLGPSQFAAQVEVGVWLQDTLLSLKPILDSRMAAVANGQDLSLKGVLFTQEQLPDGWPFLLVIPHSENDIADGVSAPDRREFRASYSIRAVSYGDNPAWKARALAQLLGTLKDLLNTRKLREAALPSGRGLFLAQATQLDFGRTEDTWDEASELTWSCTLVQTGVF